MIRAALKNPHLIVVMALALVLVGWTSYQKIPADLLPIFKTSAVQIVTFYPGMPPEVMARSLQLNDCLRTVFYPGLLGECEG